MSGESFTIDPRVWILPPYKTCPFCGAEKAYGVLMITGRGYVRRCRECMKDEGFDLPPAPKKLLYLDQFAISKLMIAIHPEHRERLEKKEGVEQAAFWLKLFEHIDCMVKLHLLACPDSFAHWEESLPASAYPDLRRMYEHLSADVSYRHASDIKRAQVHAAFIAWLDGGVPEQPTTRDATDGEIDRWTERMQIRARLEVEAEELADIQEVRERTHAGLAAEAERWRTEPRREFSDYYEEQLAAAGPIELQAYGKWAQEAAQMTAGLRPPDPNLILPPASAHTIYMLKTILEERGVPEDQRLTKVGEFFESEAARELPWVKIACGMLAALAVKASRQQAKAPNAGMVTDINTIATVLPYCDAIFIDNECAELLHTATEQVPLDYEAKVFSTRSRDELLAWLDEVEAAASPEHLALVDEVYGLDWSKPYTTMFEPQETAEND